MSFIWFIIAGLLAGVLSGMGMGGGTVLIPMLTLFLGVEQHTAQGLNMLAFLPGAALAICIHKRGGRLEVKKARPLLLWGIIGAVGGALLATVLDAGWLRRAFGAFLCVLAVIQWRKAGKAGKMEKKAG